MNQIKDDETMERNKAQFHNIRYSPSLQANEMKNNIFLMHQFSSNKIGRLCPSMRTHLQPSTERANDRTHTICTVRCVIILLRNRGVPCALRTLGRAYRAVYIFLIVSESEEQKKAKHNRRPFLLLLNVLSQREICFVGTKRSHT